jgi:hypothetical protein
VPKRPLTRCTALIAAAVLTAATLTPATAAPVPSSIATLKSAVTNPVSEVRWRGHRGNGGAVAAGIIGGLVLGGIIASSRRGPAYYYGPPPPYARGYYDPDYEAWLDYCFSRYRSFDPRSGTYLGYDGRRHYCR